MAKEKTPKRKRSFIVCFLVFVLCAYFAISLVTVRQQISATNAEIAAVKEKSAEQIAENKRIQGIIDSGDKDEYVKVVARDNGYVMPGERVYYDVSVND